MKTILLFETGSAKYIRTHGVDKPQFHSSYQNATEFLAGTDLEGTVEAIAKNHGLGYLLDTIVAADPDNGKVVVKVGG